MNLCRQKTKALSEFPLPEDIEIDLQKEPQIDDRLADDSFLPAAPAKQVNTPLITCALPVFLVDPVLSRSISHPMRLFSRRPPPLLRSRKRCPSSRARPSRLSPSWPKRKDRASSSRSSSPKSRRPSDAWPSRPSWPEDTTTTTSSCSVGSENVACLPGNGRIIRRDK